MQKHVNLEIMNFVEREILPRYNAFGQSHGLRHVQRVIRNSLDLVSTTGADTNMVYVIAAYHDLGMEGPRAVHHITGGKILASDMRLRRWFSTEQIRIMKEAVEDHRASASHAPRSIYGMIVAEADRDLEPIVVFERAIEYGLENYPMLDNDKQWKRFDNHMEEKYGLNGYIKLWIPNSPNEKRIKALREIIGNKLHLHQIFDEIYAKLTDRSNVQNNPI